MSASLFDLLSRADPVAPANAIFVLAGQKSRKLFAIQLLEQGIAPRVLFSVSRFEIRRFPELDLPQTIDLLEMAKNIPPPQRHFFVLFENRQFIVQRIPVRILGTLGEIDALADWLARHPQIASLIIVSSASHLRRLRMCCRSLLPRRIRTIFVATPGNQQSEPSEQPSPKTVLLEYFKIACYVAFLPVWKWTRTWRSRDSS